MSVLYASLDQMMARLWAGGRVVECAGLEIQFTFRRNVSSNLTLPANHDNEALEIQGLFCLLFSPTSCQIGDTIYVASWVFLD